MNQTVMTIKSRRSTRAFSEDQISSEDLNEIIEAGLYAPSAHNQQSWHFTIVQNIDLIGEISIATKQAIGSQPDNIFKSIANNDLLNIFYNAPTIIIVSGNLSSMMPVVDCAAATQNMLIAAESLGISSCWVGLIAYLFNSKESELFYKLLGIPEGHKPYHAIALGFGKNVLSSAPARKDNRVTFIK